MFDFQVWMIVQTSKGENVNHRPPLAKEESQLFTHEKLALIQ